MIRVRVSGAMGRQCLKGFDRNEEISTLRNHGRAKLEMAWVLHKSSRHHLRSGEPQEDMLSFEKVEEAKKSLESKASS